MTLSIHLKEAENSQIEALIEQIKGLDLVQSVETFSKKKASKKPEMAVSDSFFSEKDFWEVIEKLDWTDEEADEKVLAPAIAALEKRPLAHLYRFADLLSEKLFLLDTKAHAEVFLEAEDGFLSVDDFLYARCAVVANGRKAFEKVLKNPSKMPTEVTFEALLHLSSEVYLRKMGVEKNIETAYNFETYSNRAGWKS